MAKGGRLGLSEQKWLREELGKVHDGYGMKQIARGKRTIEVPANSAGLDDRGWAASYQMFYDHVKLKPYVAREAASGHTIARRRALRSDARRDQLKATRSDIASMKTIVHELNHSATRATVQAKFSGKGFPLVVEEVSVELAARKMVLEQYGDMMVAGFRDGYVLEVGSYQRIINLTVDNVRDAVHAVTRGSMVSLVDKTVVDAIAEAGIKMRGRGVKMAGSSEAYLRQFSEHIDWVELGVPLDKVDLCRKKFHTAMRKLSLDSGK